MKTIVQGVVGSAAFLILILLLATSATCAAEPPIHSLRFKPWINGVSSR